MGKPVTPFARVAVSNCVDSIKVSVVEGFGDIHRTSPLYYDPPRFYTECHPLVTDDTGVVIEITMALALDELDGERRQLDIPDISPVIRCRSRY